MGSTTIFLVQPRSLSLTCVLGVKVGLRAAVFYGFPYKLRPKPKIAVLCLPTEPRGPNPIRAHAWSGVRWVGFL